jgi:hypothetical protein
MANGLLDYLSGFGTTPPEYMGGLLGQEAVDKLKGRAATTGIANAVLGYLAAPKNQNLGLGRIIGQSLQAGMTGAQGVYDNAIQDYQTKAKIDEMNRQKAIADRDLARQTQIEELTPQLFKTNPAQYKETPTGMYVPQAPVAGAVAPNFSQQYVEGAPMRELISPETRTVDTEVLQKIAALSKNPMETLTAQADLIPKLRKAGLVQTTGQQDNPFEMFVTGAQSPTVRNLANTYSKSYLSGLIDQETADKRILELGKMDESYAGKETAAADRAAQLKLSNDLNERQFQLQQQLANNTISQQEFNRQMQKAAADAKFQKVLPPMAMKLESDDLEKAYSATSLSQDINSQINSIINNGVNFNFANNARLAINAATGATDAETLAYQDYKNFVTKVTNESLRLNTGTQTDRDADRAIKELGEATSQKAVVIALEKLRNANAKKVAVSNSLIGSRRRSSGLTEDKGYSSPEIIPVPKYDPIFFDDKSLEYKNLPVGSTYINAKTGKTMIKRR